MKRLAVFFGILVLIFAVLKFAGVVELRDLYALRRPSIGLQVLAAAGRGDFGTGDFDNVPNSLDLSNLQPGDIILGGNPGGSYGRFTHAGIYIGNDEVVEMYTSSGVYLDCAETYRNYTWAAVLRVKASPEVRAAAATYASQQVGAPFFILAPRSDDGLWYCSKLAWYAYYRNGIDLDSCRNSFWVEPDALLDSPETTLISFAGTRP